MWHVSSRSGVATLRTAMHLLLTYLRSLERAAARHLGLGYRVRVTIIGVRVTVRIRVCVSFRCWLFQLES